MGYTPLFCLIILKDPLIFRLLLARDIWFLFPISIIKLAIREKVYIMLLSQALYTSLSFHGLTQKKWGFKAIVGGAMKRIILSPIPIFLPQPFRVKGLLTSLAGMEAYRGAGFLINSFMSYHSAESALRFGNDRIYILLIPRYFMRIRLVHLFCWRTMIRMHKCHLRKGWSFLLRYEDLVSRFG